MAEIPLCARGVPAPGREHLPDLPRYHETAELGEGDVAGTPTSELPLRNDRRHQPKFKARTRPWQRRELLIMDLPALQDVSKNCCLPAFGARVPAHNPERCCPLPATGLNALAPTAVIASDFIEFLHAGAAAVTTRLATPREILAVEHDE